MTTSSANFNNGYLILVNRQHPIFGEPEDLVSVSPDYPHIKLRQAAQEALTKLLNEIECGNQIVPVSGYRSKKEQTGIYESSLFENGPDFTRKYVAYPGCSEHQTGLAIDLALNQDDIDFICPDFPYDGICGELRKLAPKFGFIERYPKGKEQITGIGHEPWHFRYVGCPHAEVICRQGLTLEEYHEKSKNISGTMKMKDTICKWVDRITDLLCINKKTHDVLTRTGDRAWAEIDLSALQHNVTQIKNTLPCGCELMAVVKADAYGHDAFHVATFLEKIGVSAFAVATIDEGIYLRNFGITGKILVMGYTNPLRARELSVYKLTQTLISHDYARSLNHQGYHIQAHVKIDTGMHRLGYEVNDYIAIRNSFDLNYLQITGIYTHLCSADSLKENDIHITQTQIKKFYQLLEALKTTVSSLPPVHIQSSYGLWNYPELKCDCVRIGIALYGVTSSADNDTRLHLDLQPVLSLKAKVAMTKQIKAGEGVGYGQRFVAHKDTVIALLSIGYADGYPRNLSCGKGYVLIDGQEAPIVGMICMDQLAVDVTDISGVKSGMTAVLIGKSGSKEITAPMVAEWAGSISNEILCRIGQRVEIISK